MPSSDRGIFIQEIKELGSARQNRSAAANRLVAIYESEMANCVQSSFGFATLNRELSSSRHRRNDSIVLRTVGLSLIVGLCKTSFAPGKRHLQSFVPGDVEEGSTNGHEKRSASKR